MGPGHDRPCNQGGENGGFNWAFDHNRNCVPRMEEMGGDREKEKDGVDGVPRNRRAVLYEYRDKSLGLAGVKEVINDGSRIKGGRELSCNIRYPSAWKAFLNWIVVRIMWFWLGYME